ncbi:hypothetical protein SDC9_200751 [bioreactor metagenome]|uniref:NTF2-like N-terminal transpeptidase domain-containing protein n=1 Tax=bioreactor metagenome TaxID=1076179 RepID=A0A645IPC1_9ZZZZ
MKDMQNAKKSLEGFLKLYFNQNHKNTDGVKDNLLSYISNDSKENLTPTIDKSINEVKEQEGFLELKDTNFRLIDYKSYENTYAFMVDVIYNTSNNETIRVPYEYSLNYEEGSWKIKQIRKMGYNFIASQNK